MVTAPAGAFIFHGHEASRVVLIAGGIGITPLMSIVRSLTDRAWPGEIYLLLSVRRVVDIPFRDELAHLEARFRNFHLRIVVSNDPETPWSGRRGTITQSTIQSFVPDLRTGPIFVCGPAPMMAAMREILVDLGVPDADVRQEAFVSRPAPEAGGAGGDGRPAVAATIAFTRSGRTIDAAADLTVLEAAEECGMSIPFECRSGICGQCKTTLTAGEVVMDVQDALTSADRRRGLILACQARALCALEVDA
jgi:ferredoxin-NADP reductase